MEDQPVARPPPTHRTTQTQNKRIQASMPRVGFEPTIPAFEQSKTVHVLYPLGLLCDPENISDAFLRNARFCPKFKAVQNRR
jgi:hypothetical protein